MVMWNNRTAAKRALLIAGGDLEKAADVLAEQVKLHPANFPEMWRDVDLKIREKLEKIVTEVSKERQHPPRDPGSSDRD
jgi:hypothetical protein